MTFFGSERLGLSSEQVVAAVESQISQLNGHGVAIGPDDRKHLLAKAIQFVPRSASDYPLVTGGFGRRNPDFVVRELLDLLKAKRGVRSRLALGTKFEHVRKITTRPTLRLVHFEPAAYLNYSLAAAREQASIDKQRLAGVEVLEYLLLAEPEHNWFIQRDGHAVMQIGGYTVKLPRKWKKRALALQIDFWRPEHQPWAYVGSPVSSSSSIRTTPIVTECRNRS